MSLNLVMEKVMMVGLLVITFGTCTPGFISCSTNLKRGSHMYLITLSDSDLETKWVQDVSKCASVSLSTSI